MQGAWVSSSSYLLVFGSFVLIGRLAFNVDVVFFGFL